MRLRRVFAVVALGALVWTSGCGWDHCWRRHHLHERSCGCDSTGYAPACESCGAPPLVQQGPPLMPAPSH